MKPLQAVRWISVQKRWPVALLLSALASALPIASAADAAPPPGGQAVERPAAEPEVKSSAGDAYIFKAHSLSSTAKTISEYSEILQLCERGIHYGVGNETSDYTKRLMSWAYNRRGEMLAEQGHDTLALEDFEASIISDKSRWRAYHNRGVSLAMLGKHKEALLDFSHAIELNPKYANAYFNRAEVLYEMSDYEGAVRDYTRAIKVEPNDAAMYNSRGHTYYRLGKYREAAQDYTVGIRLDPNNPAPLVNRGDLYAELGYYERAVSDFQEAVRCEPTYGRAFLSSAWLMATCPDAQFRSINGALNAMTKAEKLLGHDDHRYLDTLAAVQANAGNFGEARKTSEKAAEMAPDSLTEAYAERLAMYDRKLPFRSSPRAMPKVEAMPQGESTQQIAGSPRKPSVAKAQAIEGPALNSPANGDRAEQSSFNQPELK
jgi:tetratricopeptide (TPR) repeat protein